MEKSEKRRLLSEKVDNLQAEYRQAQRELSILDAEIRLETQAEAQKKAESIPVDRSAREVLGTAVAPGFADTTDRGDGQQKGYVVLTADERSKGFVRPVRHTYIHEKCGVPTSMGQALAETYARDPKFYSGTFCTQCKGHFPVGANGEFVWKDDGMKVGT
jgi:hypothetical protein